ncbi:hypothetical protein I4U23_021898 [Adineta vaga]|nr:hypothetical protein I4U23_021898 [Adineta vaga]
MASNEIQFTDWSKEVPTEHHEVQVIKESLYPVFELDSHRVASPTHYITQTAESNENKTEKKTFCTAYKWWILILCIVSIGLLIICIVLSILFAKKYNKTNATPVTSTTTTTTTSITRSTSATTLQTADPICGYGETLLTFDDLQFPFYGDIPDGYQNFNWDNAGAIRIDALPVSGYHTAVVSGTYALYNTNAFPMNMSRVNGSRFTLHSAALTAAWNDNLQLRVIGYRSNIVVANNTFTLQVFTVSNLTFHGYSALDTAVFSSSGGTNNPYVLNFTGFQFAMDNLCLSFT